MDSQREQVIDVSPGPSRRRMVLVFCSLATLLSLFVLRRIECFGPHADRAVTATIEEDEILQRLQQAARGSSSGVLRPTDFQYVMYQLNLLLLKGIRPTEASVRHLV